MVNIEAMGVDFIRLAINRTDYLVAHINDNDREPSWDGDVEVYRNAGNTHAKSDLILKVQRTYRIELAEAIHHLSR